ncbi:dentin sialophosphoprotein-like [Dorcoceras hygrometricum]|uniref:Dentin sialophosphoprotein-like n=1 Tax=Dorcoceras hygrometricum TaxID=472368 RepID=A0A2Z7CL34_9LAMI|nr:dentin sialophosphoprotein-like [Dorcoceras hygrometricum]
MVKRLATSPHDPLGITDSACKNQSVVVSVQYGPFNTYIPIRSTTIGKSRVAIDPIAMHTSWRSNSDIASVTSIGYPRMSASGESSTTMHRLLHASGSHPIPTPDEPKSGSTVQGEREALQICCYCAYTHIMFYAPFLVIPCEQPAVRTCELSFFAVELILVDRVRVIERLGFPGFSAGRGDDPAEGAPGDG